MPRLPVPGKDEGSWGNILNDFLLQSHHEDGSLKIDAASGAVIADNSVITTAVADGAITEAKLASAVAVKLNDKTIKLDGTTLSSGTNGLKVNAVTDTEISSVGWSKVAKNGAKVSDLDVPTYAGNNQKFLGVDASGSALAWGTPLVNNAIVTTMVADAAITEAKLAPAVTAKLNDTTLAANSVVTATITDAAITEVKLAAAVATKLNDKTIKLDGTTLSSGVNGLKVNTVTDAEISSVGWSKVTKTGAKVSDLDVPAYTGNDRKFLGLDATGSTLVWGTPATTGTQTYVTTVGRTGSGADYECDGVSDDVQIQTAINVVTTRGGGVIKILSGNYDIRTTILVPKDPQIRIEGEYTAKVGYGGTVLKASTTLVSAIEAIIKEAGNAVANSSNADHSHVSHYSRLIFDGNSFKSTVGLLLYNTDHSVVSDCKFTGVDYGIDGQFNGSVALADYAGGLRVERSSFYSRTANIRLDSHTQDWITDSWFLGVPQTHIQFTASNKIHLSNNEFNTVSGQVFIFADTVALPTGSINITGGFIDAGAGKVFWTDTRTNASSKGIVFAGVRFVQGTKTKLFNQEKEPQVTTYTNADLNAGVVTANYNDDAILLNGSAAAIPLQLPAATAATKNIFVKAISVTNAVTILPNGSDTIEQNGVAGAVFTFTEVNQSVLLTSDTNKWRVLADHRPSAALAVATVENVIEVATSYTVPIDKDIILVNANSSAITITLPAKATKYAASRKNFVVKVISATNPVTIVATGADQIDTSGQTSIVVTDLRAVTFVSNSGSRWRTYSSSVVGGATTTIQYNDAGTMSGAASFVWDKTNARVGIGSATPNSKLDIGGAVAFKRRAVAASTTSGDETLLSVTDTTVARTITLRTLDTVTGRTYTIKDESGAAAAHPITLNTESSQKIDGQLTYSIAQNYGSVMVYCDGANWFTIASR